MTTPAVAAARPLGPRLRRWVAAVALGLLALGGYLGLRWHWDRTDRRTALELAATNRFDVAEPLLRRIGEQSPQDVEVVRALALGYLDARQLTEAETFLDRWCELRPGEAEPYKRRLDLWTKQQNVSRALADVEQILRIEPDNIQVRKSSVHLLLIAGCYEQAEQEGLRCLKAQPNDVGMWYLVARSQYHQGRTAEATALTDRLLNSAPDFPGGRELRAELYLAGGQLEPAIPLLRQAADTPGRDPSAALYQLSVALARAGRDDEAKKVLAEMQWRRALALWSEDRQRDSNPGLQARVVEAFLAADKTEEAVRFLTGILARNPSAAGTHRLLATCYDKQGRPELAAEHRRRAGQ